MSANPKLLVFDWDGTLMDSESRILACMRAAAEDARVPIPSEDAAREIIGLGLREAVRVLFPTANEALVDSVVAGYRRHYLHQNETPTPMFDGAKEVLRELAERGYLLAVATGKGRQGLNSVLRQTGLEPLFHATRSADEAFSKPHPQMLLQLLDELGVAAEEALMIGDTEYDLQMASNAGVCGLAVSYGVHEEARLLQHSPLGIIHDVSELIPWLESRGGSDNRG